MKIPMEAKSNRMFTKLVKGKEKGKIGPVLSQLSTMP
jgi:hypothetical protein